MTNLLPAASAALFRRVDALAGRRRLHPVLFLASAALTAMAMTMRSSARPEAAAVCLLGATALLGAVFLLGWRSPVLDRRLVLAVSALLLVLAVAGPVRGARDLWSYTMYGREVSVHHVNPYTHLPDEFPNDPFLHRVAPHWRHAGSLYGPLFIGYAAVVTHLAGSSARLDQFGFQGLAALSVFAALLLLYRRDVPAAALACLGIHPLVILYVVGGGHMDPLIGLAVLGGVLLCSSRRPGWAGIVLGLGILVKFVAGLAGVGLVVWLWSRRDPANRDRRSPEAAGSTARFVLGCGSVTIAGYAAAGGRAVLEPLRLRSNDVIWPSVWAVVRPLAKGTPFASHLGAAAAVLILIVAAILLRRHRHDDGPVVIVSAVLLAYILCSGFVLVWYLVWLLPVCLLRWRTLTSVAALAYSVAIFVASVYHPDADDRFRRALFEGGNGLHVFAVLTLITLVATAVHGRHRTRPAPDLVPTR